METIEPSSMSKTGDLRILPPEEIIPFPDSSITTTKLEFEESIDSTGEPLLFGLKLKPNFIVEGVGEGDSRVTIGNIPESQNESVTSNQIQIFEESLTTDTDRTLISGQTPTNGEASLEPSSLSRHNSEEMPLSLVSWYSEPGDTNPHRHCCTRADSLTTSISCRKPLSPTKITDGSEEKENKTPNFSISDLPHNSLTNSRTLVTKLPMLTNLREKAHGQDLNEKRLDNKDKASENERGRSGGTHSITGTVETEGHGKLECPRCIRKSKSGTATPAQPSRTPRRQIQSNRKTISNTGKPIKSILKNESRGSSGREKDSSSMDSLRSSSGPSPILLMTRSDVGTRTTAKFIFKQSDGSISQEREYAGLKRIERYATLRLNKQRVKPVEPQPERLVDPRKLSFDNIASGIDFSPELMSKSMSFLEKPPIVNGTSESGTGLKRQGSLRGRKPSPGWEPCATRTSVLRMLKMQESKAKNSGALEKPSSGPSTDSGESLHSQNPTPAPQAPRNSGSEKKRFTTKVFSKLSSVLGQTASSSQKRIRQDRGIQTDPTMLIKKIENYRGNYAQVHQRSPTPISPIPTDEITEGMNPTEEVKILRLALQTYKSKAIKYQHAYEAAEFEKSELRTHLQELEMESKEMVNFLQDEKSTLAESLTEAENEIKKITKEMEIASFYLSCVKPLVDPINGHPAPGALDIDFPSQLFEN